MDGDYSLRAFLVAIGLAMLSGTIETLVSKRGRDAFAAAIAFLALLIVGTGFLWGHLPFAGTKLGASAESVASNFWVWLTLFLLVWIYGAVRSVIITRQRDQLMAFVEQSIIPIQLAMERFVLPRELTPDHIRIIASHLRKHPPFVARIFSNLHDSEANSFAQDLRMALVEGGWTISHMEYEAITHEGWYWVYEMTPADSEKAGKSKVFRPDLVLLEAFKLVGIPTDSSSGGGSGTEHTTLTIRVGPRRRDRHAVLPARFGY
jgi:hypothetical protein